ncbi:MAG TPA: GNAT family N-acetyltransferase, partial [Candidatus Dormibacteraeota bacterium]|nr:GNAT family N-acetyltransferase [Candidatus Dormibacteraeota bacterium]
MKSGQYEIDLTVSPDVAWNAVIAGGRRDWYYRLTPDVDLVEGAHIRWQSPGGSVAEESDVVEVVAPRRLVMKTRYVFVPNLAAEEPHKLEWEVLPSGSGSRVSLKWEAGDVVGAVFQPEAESMLLGLRLAVDPEAQGEIARLESIGPLEIRDLTPERLDDYLQFFDHDAFRDYPAWRSCYCMETHRTISDEEWATRTAEENRRDMVELIKQGKVTSLLAYEDGKPVGWCNYGPTTTLDGVMRRFKLEAPEHRGVGSVACFVIAAPYRGHGIASRLLDT